ncbi:LOW QUALITY PROTEIN: mucin-5B-like [Lethenteron reissneri]|uniref:LOW QUALITY PROTEIN: mucin-5B-like n=1 Tax=Lethenteron reissneri TaxID=7753 RepID=UPI002AB7D1B3|nr:LOW QUALITY PROTEIN: mucin-5B-like [Lethenteron reissneri]
MGLRLILQLSLCMLSVARSQQAICTTWGGGFFKTFDGAFFKFSSNCSYMFFQDCRSSYEEFNIKISHGANEQFSEILFKIDTDVAQFANGKVSFNNRILTLPFSNNKILIQTYGSGVKLAFRQLEISAYLNDDAFTVVAGDEFRQQLCGLCGNFDGSSSVTTSYILPDIKQYLIQPKSSGKCTAVVTSSCKDEKIQTFCKETLNGIGSCGLDQGGYAAMCAIEKCQCGSATTCGCAALSAYSRECSLQYKPLLNWRSSQLCPPQDCPGNLEYQECGSTCPPTCANMDPSKCQEACAAGCVCPSGTVLSAINEETCIAPEDCRCNYNGITYDVSDKITIDCNSCTCEAGSWTCTTRLCPKACSLESGAHFNTFDSRSYTFHGVCSYYLAVGDDWSVEVLLKSCPTGLVDRTCLDSIHLKTPMRSLEFKSNGKIISSQMGVSLPYISDSVKVFRKSSMFIQVDTSYGMMMLVQNSPTMQVYIGLIDNVMFRETGLCGNFNGIASDDFMSSQGLVEGTAAAFANSWKVNPDCDDVGTVIRDPCQLNTAVAKQAELRCAILRNSTAFFKDCHYLVDPYSYYSRCKQDACSCPSGQDCITETFLSYALACASKGLIFENWRKATDSQLVECPNGEVYSYNANACNQTCRSLSSVDLACQESGLVAEGCQCAEGLFANDEGMCVPAASCPCYVNGDTLKPGEKVTIVDIPCYCREGQLICSESKKEECTSPMVYVDCITSTYGKACESSCAIQTPLCLGRQCQPGCICPEGLINNGNGDCVKKEECPCQHNGLSYTPGDTIKVDCNKCKCYSGSWNCTELQCDSTCKMYGDGHYTTFDGQRFQFDGNCEYVVAQDFCVSDPKVGTFQIITENIPCGSMSTCSKSIRFLLQNKEIKLADGKYEIHDVSGSASKGSEEVFTVHTVGLYLIVKASNGIKLIWDRRTSLFIIAPPDKENQLCGLCGKYNFDMSDDFTMRDRSLSASALHFGNSWKASDTCSDVTDEASPCEMNPYRKAWSERKCSILKTDVFEACHSQVDHIPFYEACVRDSCACNIGGDCECFCTSVAAYAEACTSAGQCVAWRTPDLCPVFCDYYNSPDSCTWHYRPCGIVNTKTCGNPAGINLGNFPHLEGCYPKCPAKTPYLDEHMMTCVSMDKCSCEMGSQIVPANGTVVNRDTCETCTCVMGNMECVPYDCCQFNGGNYLPGETIFTSDGLDGLCHFTAACELGGHIHRESSCQPTTPIITGHSTTASTVTTVTFTTKKITTAFSSSSQSPAPTTTLGPLVPTTTLATLPKITTISTIEECYSVKPPRQFMESWKVDNCTIATCNGGDNISYSTKKCSVSTKPKCRNAMMVYDADGCCYTWKCFCNCKGWGDPHIRTFDQVLYAFLEDCTYTLVEEKVNRHHLSIITDNFQFFPGTPASFPRGITVNYNGNSVNMSIPAIVRKKQSIITVLYNNELVKLPFSSDGIEITSTDVIVTVHIPAIYSTIVFTGQMYSIDLPYELFGDNTQGQCGTCNNQASDDCVRKSGKSEASDCCQVTAKEWMVADPSKPHCKSPGPSGSVPCQTPTPTPTAPCVFDHKLCKAIDKTEFSACLEVTSLLSYIETCKFDQCRVNSIPAGCPSIQSAADDCAMLGYFVDWRKATEGGCDFECPVGMEYKPAGPKPVASCSSGGSVEMTTELREGCFCPEGTMICDHACVPLPTSTTPPSTTQEKTTTVTFTTGKPSTTEVPTPAVTTTVHEPITTVVLTTTTLSTAGSTPGQSTAPQSQTTAPYVEQTTTIPQSGGTPVQTTISEPHQSTSSGETSTAPLSTTAFISSATSLGSLPTLPETTAVSTTVDKGCHSVNPPRQFMESWKVDNCTIATCNGGDNISYSTKKCSVSTKPKCRNAMMVYDADGCCYTWKCFCNCKGWGDPHIRTFDQVLYAFLEDCTYTLVEEKVNRHHLSIITDNFQFFPGTPASFPRGITVNYNGNSVNMSIPAIVRKKQSIITVLYNNELVKLPFSSDGIEITSTDVIVTVHIPAIYSTIVFTGQMYSIDLPYELFGDNTQGQCGTCNNQASDDCVRKSGKSEASDCCQVTAKEWMVADPSKPHCKSPGPSGSVPCQTPTPTPTAPCVFDHKLCKAIDKTEFSACLEVTSLLSYIETCKFDQCRVNSIPAGCPSIQSAADDCAMLGYFVDWRKATEGGCDFECPVGMEYKPAGPKPVASCSSGGSVEMTTELREGCFCPEGTMICDHACVPLPTSTTPPSTTQEKTTTVTFTTGKPSTTEVPTPAVTTTVHEPITTVVLTTTTLSTGGSTRGQSKSSTSAFTSPTISHRPVSTTPPMKSKASTTKATSTVVPTTRSHVEPTITPVTVQTVQATRPLSTSTFNKSSSDAPCVCKINGFTAKPDGTLHVIKDDDGWCYYMSCSSNCFAITTSHRRCDTASTKTQNETSQPTTRPASTSVAPSSSQPSGCFYKDHHYKVGEKWQIDSCTTATCRSGNQVMTEPVVCLNPPMPKCRNPTTMPVKVYDNNGCCYTWKCNCQCQGWGDPHYRTFDGQKYIFLEDCTYTLVEEKINKYAFSVLVDNYYFYKDTPASFVRGITVNYNGNSANISLPAAKGRQTVINKVIFNGQAVAFPFVGKGFVITNHETQILVEIPAIGASVSFTGMMFTVDLPYSLFGNNTQGQCGTCNNARGDDCMRRSGVVEDASCCAVTAADWMVPDASKPHCRAKAPTGQKPCPSTTPTTRPYCTADTATICDIITSNRAFAGCAEATDLSEFFDSCVFDTCTVPTALEVGCASLQVAAEQCAALGFYVDWRSLTRGMCQYNCSSGLEYQPMRPKEQLSCDYSGATIQTSIVEEGCFCPKGMKMFNSQAQTCVVECGCMGPQGTPVMFGDSWQSDCKECVCDKASASVQCAPIKCPKNPEHSCKPWETQELVTVDKHPSCCPIYACVPRRDICLYKEEMYQIGQTWNKPGNNCTQFICTSINELAVMEEKTIVCKEFDITNCIKGTVTTDEYGCCKTCSIPKLACQIFELEATVSRPRCEPKNITLSTCEGTCASRTYFDMKTMNMASTCDCCKPEATEERTAVLDCKGVKTPIQYTYIKSCECKLCK